MTRASYPCAPARPSRLASAQAGQLVEPRTIELSDFFEDLLRALPLFGERDFQL
jgi:hypothetical protein